MDAAAPVAGIVANIVAPGSGTAVGAVQNGLNIAKNVLGAVPTQLYAYDEFGEIQQLHLVSEGMGPQELSLWSSLALGQCAQFTGPQKAMCMSNNKFDLQELPGQEAA
jgi:hypothetical protein